MTLKIPLLVKKKIILQTKINQTQILKIKKLSLLMSLKLNKEDYLRKIFKQKI